MSAGRSEWKAGWTQAVTDIQGASSTVRDVTLRLTVPLALGGERVRLQFSNRYGAQPVHVGHAAIVTDGSSTQVSFNGRCATELPPGAEILSDPIEVVVRAGSDLFVDVFLPEEAQLSTGNLAGGQWSISEAGNHAGNVDLVAPPVPSGIGPDGVEYAAPLPLLRGVEVAGHEARAVVACLGDSITAAGWPERASALLKGSDIALLNRGLAGNRLRRDGAGFAGAFFGRSGLKRFDDDVLGTAGVTHAIIALGTNDLGHPGTPAAPEETVPSASDLTDALAALVERSRSAGILTVLATITPFLPAAGYDTHREAIRNEVNEWIRSPGRSERIIDFDRVLRSSPNPTTLKAEYDSGDHLHPSAAGLERLAREATDVLEEICPKSQVEKVKA